MKSPSYSTQCTVIKTETDEELFYMNMRVFRVVPSSKATVVQAGDQVSNIWCAVYHLKRGEMAEDSPAP